MDTAQKSAQKTAQKMIPSKLEELEVMFVSGVAQPATGERFILLKDAQGTTKFNAWVKNLRAVNPALADEMDDLLSAGDYAALQKAVANTGNAEMAAQVETMLTALAVKDAGVIKTTRAKDKGAGNDPDMDDDSHDEAQEAPNADAKPQKIAAPKKKGGTSMAKSMAVAMAKTFADAAGMEVVPAGTTEMLAKFQEASAAVAKSITAGAGTDDAPVNSAQPFLDDVLALAGQAQAPTKEQIVSAGKAPDIAEQADILRGTPFDGSADRATVLMGTPFDGSADTAGIVSGTPAQKSAWRKKKMMADATC